LGVIKVLGAQIETLDDGSLKITGNGVHPAAAEVNCGESGLGIRMFAPIVALSKEDITIRGEGSLLSRPMDFFDEILPRLGVESGLEWKTHTTKHLECQVKPKPTKWLNYMPSSKQSKSLQRTLH
jgi:5-enolpyruvylshikimate-3-phosphate synthase